MKKRLFSLFLICVLLALCAAPAFAFADYVLVYDATERLDADILGNLGESVFPALRDAYGIEVRVDVVNDLEGYEIADYADLFYDNFEYGSGDDHSGILLMLYLTENEDDLEYGGSVLTSGGSGNAILEQYGGSLSNVVEETLGGGAMDGPLETDTVLVSAALTEFAAQVEAAVRAALPPADPEREADGGLVSLDEEEAQPAEFTGTLVYDEAGILTEEQRDALQQKSLLLSNAYQCGIYTVVVGNYLEYATTSDVFQAACDIYTANDLGFGPGKDGVMLLLSMDDRDYSLIAYGYGNTAFTDYGKDVLADEFLDNFRYDDWYGGLNDYVDGSGELLRMAREGNPLDSYGGGYSDYDDGYYDYDDGYYYGTRRSGPSALGIGLSCIVIPGAVAGVVCGHNVNKMKSVRAATGARNYAVPGSLSLMVQNDIFTHTTESRVRVVSDTNRGGGGGGTSIHSSGFSGKSGKF